MFSRCSPADVCDMLVHSRVGWDWETERFLVWEASGLSELPTWTGDMVLSDLIRRDSVFFITNFSSTTWLWSIFSCLQNLTDANELLQQRSDDLQKNLEDAVQQMDRTTEDYVKLKVCLHVCVWGGGCMYVCECVYICAGIHASCGCGCVLACILHLDKLHLQQLGLVIICHMHGYVVRCVMILITNSPSFLSTNLAF